MSVAPGYPVRRWTEEQLDARDEVGPHSQITRQGASNWSAVRTNLKLLRMDWYLNVLPRGGCSGCACCQ